MIQALEGRARWREECSSVAERKRLFSQVLEVTRTAVGITGNPRLGCYFCSFLKGWQQGTASLLKKQYKNVQSGVKGYCSEGYYGLLPVAFRTLVQPCSASYSKSLMILAVKERTAFFAPTPRHTTLGCKCSDHVRT